MPQTISAKKRVRQNARCRARNRRRKDRIKVAVKAFETTVQGGKPAEMAEALKACHKQLDQVAAKGTIHKRTAARRKARLSQAMNQALE